MLPGVVSVLTCVFVLCHGDASSKRSKRSTDFPTFQEVTMGQLKKFKIENSDCHFEMPLEGCPNLYGARGTCTLSTVLSQLFPDVDIADSTNNFIVPSKYQVARIESYSCQRGSKNGIVTFVADSVESVELVPQKLTLGAETSLKLSWNILHDFKPEKLAVELDGLTSIGDDTEVELSLEKEIDGIDYLLDFSLSILQVSEFLEKFGISPLDMIDADLSFANGRMGLANLIMQEAEVGGLFSPGGGFEIIATGRIAAPELPADASKFYLIVQDFKNGPSGTASQSYSKAVAAIFALYEGETVPNAISSLAHIEIPSLAIFKDVNEVVITAATNQIYNINSRKLRDIAAKYVPIEGMDMISKGLTVMHFAKNNNDDIKDKDEHTADKVLFRCEIGNNGLTWRSPQRIETELRKLAGFVWSFRGCRDEISLHANTKGVLDGITYNQDERQMEVNFNLTERIPVLENDLVSLFKSTITLYSREKTSECSWMIKASGQETILDELVDITLTQKSHRTILTALAQIYDMNTLMSRVHAKPFDSDYESAFPFLTTIPFENLRYEASFQKMKVLNFKGFALVEGKPSVEVIYYIHDGQPQLKLGLQFNNKHLYKAINMFYREDKIKSTWIKFRRICIAIKNQELDPSMKFDRNCLERADSSFSSSGIRFLAEDLVASDCNGNEWKMCAFINTYIGEVLDITYKGQILPDRVTMRTSETKRFDLGIAVTFYGTAVVSRIYSKDGGDLLSFEANLFLQRTFDMVPARIYDDGTNKIMLDFQSENGYKERGILGLNYARMDPVRGKFELSPTEKVNVIKFQSRLHIGTVLEQQIEISGSTGRQYVSYNENDYTVNAKFVGERSRLHLKKIFNAFGLPDNHQLLKQAKFQNQVVIGYATEGVWEVPEFDVKVKKGLHFYGKLTLKTNEVYETTVNLLETMQLQTVIHLDPLRYGQVKTTSDGKPILKNINLFLFKHNEVEELGPDLVCEGQTQYLRGFAQTVGLEGPFTTETIQRGTDKFEYLFKLHGNLYKEVQGVELILSTEAKDKPKEFKFKYQVDITQQGRANVNSHLREVLSDIKTQAKKGLDKATEVENDVRSILEATRDKHERFQLEISSIERQIHNINSDVDLAMIDVSTDCINLCRTVAMPGISWKPDCLSGSDGQLNMDCMTWSEDSEKVVNVVCLLKCEAKKIAAAGEAASSLDEIRILVNRYRERKVLYENIGKSIQLMQQAEDLATNTKDMVDDKTDIQDEVDDLLGLPGDLVEINVLRVDEDLEELSPPCLPFQLDFTLKTAIPTTLSGPHSICFNGEFYKNVGLRMMRMKYTTIDTMYKVLEEAELRYVAIETIKKSLKRAEEDVHKSTKRGDVPSQKVNSDPIENMLGKIAKRRVPTFTLRGDRTVLAFNHYSPWATIKRSNPFENEPAPSHQMKYNASSIQGKSACHQTKEIISEYRDISDNLEKLSRNYRHGKALFGKKKTSIQSELKNSKIEIHRLMNKTKLSRPERKDMLYWYQFTKKGMNNYLQTFMDRLENQNKRSLSYLRNHLSSFYGTQDFVRQFNEVGTKAFTRSNIDGAKRDKHILALNDVGQRLHQALFDVTTLDDASAAIAKAKKGMERLDRYARSCY